MLNLYGMVLLFEGKNDQASEDECLCPVRDAEVDSASVKAG
jgi:hypothetical protein